MSVYDKTHYNLVISLQLIKKIEKNKKISNLAYHCHNRLQHPLCETAPKRLSCLSLRSLELMTPL